MSELSVNELKFIIARVLDNANDVLSDKDNSEFAKGKRLAYYEILDTVKNELEVRDVDLSDFKLDISLEQIL